MNKKIYTLFCINLIFISAIASQRSRGIFQKGSSLAPLSRTSPTLSVCPFQRIPVTTKKRTLFSLSRPSKHDELEDISIQWRFKPNQEQKEHLFETLAQKLQGHTTKILQLEEPEDIIERLAEKNIINEPNKAGKTPLIIALENTTKAPRQKQKRIMEELAHNGASLYDLQALSLAIKTANLGALEVLQPHYRLRDLYPEFKKLLNELITVKKRINEFQKSPRLKKVYEDHFILLKEELKILSRPVKPIFAEVQEFDHGKEQDIIYEIHSTAELYELEKNYSVKMIHY